MINKVRLGVREIQLIHEERLEDKDFAGDRRLVRSFERKIERKRVESELYIAELREAQARDILKIWEMASSLHQDRERGLEHIEEGLQNIEEVARLSLDLIAQDKESHGISVIARGGGARFNECRDAICQELDADQVARIRTFDSTILGVPYAANYKTRRVTTPTGEEISLEDYRPLKLSIPPDVLSECLWGELRWLRALADERDKNSYLVICGGREAMYAMGVGEKFEISSVYEVFLEKRTMEFRIKHGKLL